MTINNTTGHLWLARIAGAAGIGSAAAIISADALKSGQWQLDNILMIGVIGVTVAAGHLIWRAIREWKIASAIGFAILFCLGTGVTLYNSVGRQAASADAAALKAQSINDRIYRRRADLEQARTDLLEADARVAAETKTGCKRICEDWTRRAQTIRSEIPIIEAELLDLGPPVPVAPKAGRVAQLLAWGGYDEASTKELLQLVDPFLLALWAELTAIVALGYGFPSHSPIATQREPSAARGAIETDPPPAARSETKPETVARSETVASLRYTRRTAEADLRSIVQSGKTVPSQDALAERWDVPKGTVSRWLSSFEERGIIVRETVGRRKTVSAR